MLRLSPSALSVFRDCPRKYSFRYVLGVEPVREDGKLAFGRAWDSATGACWEGGIEAAVSWLVANSAGLDPVDAAKIAALLTHYHPPRERFEFVGNQVEQEIRPEGLRGIRVLCIADTLLKDLETGQTVVRECKTTSREIEGFGPYWQRLQVDAQLGAYWHAFGASRIYYDVTQRPGIRCCGKDEKEAGPGATPQQVVDAYQKRLEGLVVESPEKFFAWRPVDKTDADAESAMSDIREDCQRLREAWKAQRWPRNSNHCINVYGTCPFLDVCSGRASTDDPSLFRSRERRPA